MTKNYLLFALGHVSEIENLSYLSFINSRKIQRLQRYKVLIEF